MRRRKRFFYRWGKRCLAVGISCAVALTTIIPRTGLTTVQAAGNDNDPYVVSANRPVYASSQNGGDTAAKAVDGDKATRWQAAQEDKNEWIYVDLGKVTQITSVYVHWEAAAASEYKIQFSDDEATWSDEVRVTDGKEAETRTFDVNGNARFVRMLCEKRTGGYGASLWEFQVYGLDGLTPRPEDYGENLALNNPTEASSCQLEWWMRVEANQNNFQEKVDDMFDNGYPVDAKGNLLTNKSVAYLDNGFIVYEKGMTITDQRNVRPDKAVDGKIDDSGWHTNGGDAKKRKNDQWMYVDLGKEYEIGRILLNWKDPARAYRIEVSNDAKNWTPIYSQMNEYVLNKNIPIYATGRYVRVYCMASWDFGAGFGLKELQVYKYRNGDEKKTYDIEQEPEVTSVEVPNSDATYATDDVRFPMAKPPIHMNEDLQMPNNPVASNDWWQTIAIKDFGDGLVVLPYRTKYSANGLDIVEVNDCWYAAEDQRKGALGSATVNKKTDFTLTPEGMDTTKAYDQILSYSDYAIKAQLCDAKGPVMTNTIIKGSPYIFSEFEGDRDVVIYSTNITGVYGDDEKELFTGNAASAALDHFGLEITDDDNKLKTKTAKSWFSINLPENTTVTKVGNKIKIHFSSKNNYMSIGAMTKRGDLKTFYDHGYAFVTDTKVGYDYDETTSKITTHYVMKTELKRAGFDSNTIQCLFPHQYKKLASTNQPKDMNLPYVSSRGTMKGYMLHNNKFDTQDTFYGMVPQFTTPQDTESTEETVDHIAANGREIEKKKVTIPGYDDALITKYLSQVEANTHNKESLPGGDAYWQGKSLHPLAQATLVADQSGNLEYRDMFLERLRYIFDDWFTYSGEDDDVYFYYDKNWGTLYYRYSEFGANWGICDHHFTYGYFLFAAAVLATYDNDFYEQYKEMLDLIVRDFASPDYDDDLFCRFRSFDLYEGHSWAGGYADNDDGNNQEAGGESLFGWVGMYLWSIKSNNTKFRDAAIFGFTTELNDVEQYWFNYDGDNWPKDYPHSIVGQNYGANIFYGTFFDGNTTSVYGIHWLPVTEWITHYSMGDKKDKLQKMYEGFLDEIQAQYEIEKDANKPKVKTSLTAWQHLFVPLRSQYDANSALDDYWQVCNGEATNGEGKKVDFDSTEQFNAYWFAHSMRDLGNKTDKIYPAGGVCASVYKKDNTYTAIVWNPTDDDITVPFTDGKKIVGSATIGAQSLARCNPLEETIQVSTPQFSLASDTYEETQYLEITSATDEAVIHYTTDGSTPTSNSPVYQGAIPISGTTTIKAIATKEGCIDSKMDAVTITIQGTTITTGENIALGKSVTASTNDENAKNVVDGDAKTRWQADNEDPNEWITVDLQEEHTVNKIKISWETARASKYDILVSSDNMNWATVYTENAGMGSFDEIIFEPVTARYVQVKPLERATDYGSSIYELGIYESRQIARPQFSLNPGTYGKGQKLSMASGTPAVEIRYTMDGTEPNENSTLYVPGLTLKETVTIKAKAFKKGMLPSETAEATYTIQDGAAIVDDSKWKPTPEDEVEEDLIAGENSGSTTEDPLLKTCLSYQKEVFVSSSEFENTAEKITDGQIEGTWSSAWEGLGDPERFNQYCYIDLGEKVDFNEVKIYWITINNQYKIQVSDDAKDWKDVYIHTKLSSEDKIDICRFDTVKARYVKMQGIKVGEGWGYSLPEMMVYLSEEEQPLGANVADTANITVSSENNTAGNLIDGNPETAWKPGANEEQTITLDLFKTYQIDKVSLEGTKNYTGTVTIQVSTDGQTWTTAVNKINAADANEIYAFVNGSNDKQTQSARYVKITFTGSADSLNISELKVFTEGSADIAKETITYYDKERVGAGASSKNNDAEKIMDDIVSNANMWQSTKEDVSAWCYIELEEAKKINFVSVNFEASYAASYDIYLTNDITNWQKEDPAYKGETGVAGTVNTILTNPVTAKYVIIQQTQTSNNSAAYGCAVYELRAGYRNPIPVEWIKASPTTTSLAIGQTLTATCMVSPSNADNTNVTWQSSDNNVATVSDKGVVTSKAVGTVTIKVISEGNPEKTAEIQVNVVGPITLARPTAKVTGNNEITVEWEKNEHAIGYNIYRSKSQNGLYTKVNDTLIAKDATKYVDSDLSKGTYYYKIEGVTPENDPVYQTSMSPQSIGAQITVALNQLIAPKISASINGDTVTLTWEAVTNASSYDIYRTSGDGLNYKKIGTVTKPGYTDSRLSAGIYSYKVMATGSGSWKNSAYSNVKQFRLIDETVPDSVTITLKTTSGTVEVGKTIQVEATVTPSDTPITWESNDSTIATVNNGTITGVKPGKTTITATAGEKAAAYTITVVNATVKPSENPSEKPNGGSIWNPGGNSGGYPSIKPSEKPSETPSEKPSESPSIKPSENPSIKPSEKPSIKPSENPSGIPSEKPSGTPSEKPGENNPSENNYTVSKVKIAVVNRPYNAKTIYLKKKAKIMLSPTVVTDGTDKAVKYTTSNKKIATVSSKGKVKAGSKTGTAKITVTSVAAPSKKASITIKVVAKAIPNKVLKLKSTGAKLKKKGQKVQIKLKKYTKKTTSPITYKVKSGKKYIKVNKYGVVTSKVNSGKKALTAKVQVKCGKKKVVMKVKIPKRK